jgi:streptomycin 6-kinase
MPPSEHDLLPAGLPLFAQLGRIPAARSWLDGLPDLIEQVRAAFGLRLSAPLHGGSVSWVAPAELPDGTGVIVKITWPHDEMYAEPHALRRWDGRGAVRLLAHDPDRHALILERCLPGEELRTASGSAEDRLLAGCAVLRRLWQAEPPPAGGPVDGLAEVTAHWADLAGDRMARLRPGYDPGLVDEAVTLLRTLPTSAGRTALLHGDFNPGNVLSTGGGRWTAIDPKPLVGDPAFDPWPLLEQVDDPFARPDPVPVLRHRVVLTSDALDIAPERMVAWGIARRVEAALWAAEHGDVAGGAAAMDRARVWAGVGTQP